MDDLLDALNELIADIEPTELTLREAVRAQSRVKEAVKELKSNIESADRAESYRAFENARSVALSEAPIIYAKNARDAAIASQEYAYMAFLEPLIEVGSNLGLYTIRAGGSGWTRSITVDLDMDTYAGSLDDYAEAVDSARGALKVKDTRDPDTASSYWRKKVYPDKGGKYLKTIDLRMMASASPAPFWSLLNYGSKHVSLASDIGGTPYPSRGAHRFVERTASDIAKKFRETFSILRSESFEDAKIKNEAIIQANELLIKLQAEVDRLSESGGDSFSLERIARAIGARVDELDASKIVIIMDKIRAGQPISKRSRVGVAGGRDIRVSSALTSILSEFGE